MEFLLNYWYVLLIAFILILLIILGYLIDKEKNNKIKESIDKDDFSKKFIIEDFETPEGVVADVDSNDVINEEIIEDNLEEEYIDNDSDFDEDFIKVIPKKELFGDELKKSIADLKLKPIEVNENKGIKEDIILPEIEISK